MSTAAGTDLQLRHLRAESYDCPPQELECTVRLYDRAARMRRAVAISAAMLIGAALSLPIPGWHFVAVPGFLIGAVRLGIRRWRQSHAIVAVRGSCPACGEMQDFSVPAAAALPHTLACDRCRTFLKLSDLR